MDMHLNQEVLTVQETGMDIIDSFIRVKPCSEGEKVRPILMRPSHPADISCDFAEAVFIP